MGKDNRTSHDSEQMVTKTIGNYVIILYVIMWLHYVK